MHPQAERVREKWPQAAWSSLAVLCERDLRGGSEPVVDDKVVGQGMPERDRLGLDQAGHGQSVKAAVLVMGVDALDQFAPAEDRLAFLGLHSGAPVLHRLGLFRPLVVTAFPAFGAQLRFRFLAWWRHIDRYRPGRVPGQGLDIGPRGVALSNSARLGARP